MLQVSKSEAEATSSHAASDIQDEYIGDVDMQGQGRRGTATSVRAYSHTIRTDEPASATSQSKRGDAKRSKGKDRMGGASLAAPAPVDAVPETMLEAMLDQVADLERPAVLNDATFRALRELLARLVLLVQSKQAEVATFEAWMGRWQRLDKKQMPETAWQDLLGAWSKQLGPV